MYGSPEMQPGGRALKFYASQRLDIRRIQTLKDGGGEAVGNRVRVKVVKNKLSAPFRQAEFDIEFGRGISTLGCLLELGCRYDVVHRSGAHYFYGWRRVGQSREDAKVFLDTHPTVAAEIEPDIYTATRIAAERQTEAARRPEAGGRPGAARSSSLPNECRGQAVCGRGYRSGAAHCL
jgi:recombination protein RecA